MPDVVLSDGREIDFDLHKMTIKEYRALFKPQQPDEEETATLAKVSGLSSDDIDSLPLPDWKRLTRALLNKCAQPLADPNSVSAST